MFSSSAASVLRSSAILGALVFLFAASYTQRPNYYSNQNHRFVHGLAHAGYGRLHEDWLANTIDPSPLFSALIELNHRYAHPALIYVYQIVLMAVYLVALLMLASRFLGTNGRVGWAVFVSLLLVVHSAGLGDWTKQQFDVNVRELLGDGVAQQYILGPMFQPSTLGVLLLLSVALFVVGRPYSAVVAFSLANVIYPAYLLCAALLTLSYMVALARAGRWRASGLVAGLALLLALPVVIHTAITFSPSSADTFARANAILARFRIPHHTDASQWFGDEAAFKLLLIACSIYLARTTPQGVVMGTTLAVAVGLTGLQLVLDSDSLALLFPWRSSVWLVPAAVTVLLARMSAALTKLLESRPRLTAAVWVASALLAVGVAAVGGNMMYGWFTRLPREHNVYQYVRGQLSAGQVWLTPPYLETFRLGTGAPIYVDHKSHPYKDVEVLEWHRRLEQAEEWLAALKRGDPGQLDEMISQGKITHVLITATIELQPAYAELLYQDRSYRVYRLVRTALRTASP